MIKADGGRAFPGIPYPKDLSKTTLEVQLGMSLHDAFMIGALPAIMREGLGGDETPEYWTAMARRARLLASALLAEKIKFEVEAP